MNSRNLIANRTGGISGRKKWAKRYVHKLVRRVLGRLNKKDAHQ